MAVASRAVRLAGVNIPGNAHIQVGLTHIFGVGRPRALEICKALDINIETKIGELDDATLESVREYLGKYVLEGDLRIEVKQAIQRLRNIRCYRGSRHQRGLPCRGQTTKNNARTRKGRKRSLVAGKKK